MIETDGRVVRMSITGMSCDQCVRTVRKAIESVPGVRAARVDLISGRAEIQVIPGWVADTGLRSAVAQAGYEGEIEPSSADVTAPNEPSDGDDQGEDLEESDSDGPSRDLLVPQSGSLIEIDRVL